MNFAWAVNSLFLLQCCENITLLEIQCVPKRNVYINYAFKKGRNKILIIFCSIYAQLILETKKWHF